MFYSIHCFIKNIFFTIILVVVQNNGCFNNKYSLNQKSLPPLLLWLSLVFLVFVLNVGCKDKCIYEHFKKTLRCPM